MDIAYIPPLERAFSRMKQILFKPFDVGKWLVIGFGCFLAELASGGGGGGSTGWKEDWPWDDAEGAVTGLARTDWQLPDWLPSFLTGIAVWLLVSLVLLILLLIPLLLWLSSRGRFIFLDNVLANRAAIREPWREYRREGNSLFLWRLGLLGVGILLVALAVAPVVLGAVFADERGALGGLFLTLPLLLVVVVGLLYVGLFLKDFVVPLQLKERLTASDAWRRFLPLLRQRAGSFIAYGLFVFVLWILIVAAILMLGLATCCAFLLLIAIPYVGTVVLLPVYVTFRALSLEFFGQFGPDYDLFAALAPPAPPAPAGGADGAVAVT